MCLGNPEANIWVSRRNLQRLEKRVGGTQVKRRQFLKAVGLGAASSSAASGFFTSVEAAARRPNVILVITDDQGYGDLACHGNPVIQTPNLDKMHSQSLRLADFHVSPTCSPTRAALMTGRNCNRTGVWHTIMGRSLLRRDEVTMADIFAAGGYRTGIFGKWHLGDNYPFRPQDRGFHDVMIHQGGGVGEGIDFWGNNYFDDTYFRNGEPEKFEGYCTDIWFSEAIKFIESNKDRPFFCYLTTNAAHSPYFVPDRYTRIYKEKGLPSPFAEHYGMITNIDDNMGKLMGRLEQLGLAENTILIFMTDNGADPAGGAPERFNAGMRDWKGSQYDGGHRVPFFIRWPGGGLEGGRDIDPITAHIDILPTLVELCGVKKPGEVEFDGVSLVPLLAATSVEWPERVIVTDSQRVDHPIKWRQSATMTDRWRLIDGEKLYDIKADPHQDHDVADQHPGVVTRLRSAYEEWWADTSRRFDEYCEIVIGSPEQNPTCLMCHDVHGQVVWNHDTVRQAGRTDGFWAVEVARDGTYEFSVRRWPEEVNRPITAPISIHETEPDEILMVTDVRLKIADYDETKPIPPDAVDVKFRVNLKAGKTRCQAWFVDGLGEGRTYGAYYVYVTRLS